MKFLCHGAMLLALVPLVGCLRGLDTSPSPKDAPGGAAEPPSEGPGAPAPGSGSPDEPADDAPAPSVEVDPGPPPSGLKVKVRGDATWVVRTTSRAVLLAGGGPDRDEAMRALVEGGGGGDVVVLRMDDTSPGYASYMVGLGADSVHEVVFDGTRGNTNVTGEELAALRALADTKYVATLVRNAEVVFLAGGNQTKYLDAWSGTALARALAWAVRVKGIAVGGTSAGMHVLGGVAHAPRRGGSVGSVDALADPYLDVGERPGTSGLTLEDSPLAPEILGSFALETHLSERNRFGRALVLLARTVQDQRRPLSSARLLGCDEGTAVLVDEAGRARVFGATDRGRSDYAFFMRPEAAPDTCADDVPLRWARGVSVLKVPGTTDGRFAVDVRTWQSTATPPVLVSVDNGTVTPDLQSPD